MASKRKSNQTCVCMLTTQLCRERSILSMIIALSRKILTLSEWTTTWLMDFIICKCAILPITKKRNTSFFNHAIFGSALERVDDHEYLSVSIPLCWEKHCNKISEKASKTLGLLRRTLSPCSKEDKSRAYQTLVRPQLEYAAEAWDPYSITTATALSTSNGQLPVFLSTSSDVQQEVSSSRPDHQTTLSAAKTSKLSLLVKHHILAIDEAS